MHVPPLGPVAPRFRGHELRERGPRNLDVPGIAEGQDGCFQQPILAVSEELAQGLVDPQEATR